MVISRCNVDGKDYFKVQCNDGVERIYTGKGLFVESVLDQLLTEGYKIPAYDYTQITKDGNNLLTLPEEEFSLAHIDRAERFEFNALSPEEFAQKVGNTSEAKRVFEIPERNITIHTRDEFIEYIKVSLNTFSAGIKYPINYFVADEALFSIDDFVGKEEYNYVLSILASRRQYTYNDFIRLKSWLENKLGITINNQDEFTRAYCSWGVDGIKPSEITFYNELKDNTIANNITSDGDEAEFSNSWNCLLTKDGSISIEGNNYELGEVFTSTFKFDKEEALRKKTDLLKNGKTYEPIRVRVPVARTVFAFVFEGNDIKTKVVVDYKFLIIGQVLIGLTSGSTKMRMFSCKNIYDVIVDMSVMFDERKVLYDIFAYQKASEIIDKKILKPQYNNLRDIWTSGCRLPIVSAIRYLGRYLSWKSIQGVYHCPHAVEMFRNEKQINPTIFSDILKYGVRDICDRYGLDISTVEIQNDFMLDLEAVVNNSDISEAVSEFIDDPERDTKEPLPENIICYNTLEVLQSFLDGDLNVGYLSEAESEIQYSATNDLYNVLYNLCFLVGATNRDELESKLESMLELTDLNEYLLNQDALLIGYNRDIIHLFRTLLFETKGIVIPYIGVREPSDNLKPSDQKLIGTYNIVIPNYELQGGDKWLLKVLSNIFTNILANQIKMQITEGFYEKLYTEGLLVWAFQVMMELCFSFDNSKYIDYNGTKLYHIVIRIGSRDVNLYLNDMQIQSITSVKQQFFFTDTFMSLYDMVDSFITDSGKINYFPFAQNITEDDISVSKPLPTINMLCGWYTKEQLEIMYNITVDNNWFIKDGYGNRLRLSDRNCNVSTSNLMLLSAGVDVNDMVTNNDESFDLPIIMAYWERNHKEERHVLNKFDLYDYRGEITQTEDEEIVTPDVALQISTIGANAELEDLQSKYNSSKKKAITSTLNPITIQVGDQFIEWLKTVKPLQTIGDNIAIDGKMYTIHSVPVEVFESTGSAYKYKDKLIIAVQGGFIVLEN